MVITLWLSFLPQGTENTDKSLKIAGFPKLEVFSYHWILFEKYSYSISKETLKSESLLKYVPELKLHKWGFNYKGKQTLQSADFLSKKKFCNLIFAGVVCWWEILKDFFGQNILIHNLMRFYEWMYLCSWVR